MYLNVLSKPSHSRTIHTLHKIISVLHHSFMGSQAWEL